MNNFDLTAMVLLIIQLSYSFILMIWYWRRKDFFPLRARTPFLLLLHQASYWMYGINMASWLLAGYHGPCLWYHWLKMCGDMFLATPYIIRLFQLYYRYKMTQEIILHTEIVDFLSPKEVKPYGWYTDHQRYMSTRYLIIAATILIPSAIPLCGFFTLAYPSIKLWTPVTDPVCPMLWSFDRNVFSTLQALTLLGGVAFGAIKIKEIEEGLWIKTEFLLCCTFPAIQVIFVFIPQINYRFEIEALTYFPVLLAWTTLNLLVPIILTYTTPQRKRKKDKRVASLSGSSHTASRDATLPRLERYLQNSKQFDAFWKFLSKEFAVENLIFWRDVQRIRNYALQKGQEIEQSLPGHILSVNLSQEGTVLPSSNLTLFQMLHVILETYIVPDAPQSINISDSQRSDLERKLTHISSQSMISCDEIEGIFRPALREVLGMLECDAFLRFGKSEFYLPPAEAVDGGDGQVELPSPSNRGDTSVEPSPTEKSYMFPSVTEEKEKLSPSDSRAGSRLELSPSVPMLHEISQQQPSLQEVPDEEEEEPEPSVEAI